MLNNLKIMYHQGKQYIPDVTTVEVPGIFRGRPIISDVRINTEELIQLCPTNAINREPISIDLGKCTFCGECAFAFPEKIRFTKDYKLSTNERNRLIVVEGQDKPIDLNPDLIRKEIHKLFGGSLKLRQVSAAGDNSCEWELNAAGNVNFDMGRFGIEFVASPRHADGIVITGPVSENMAEPLQICYDATPDPKLIILAGTDAISGGIFDGAPALNRSFLNKYKIDLYVAGNPVHPLSFINGILQLIRKIK
ncbi:MAG: NADH:ubiquinone oxidoreductase [Bacteroidetes bacterium GWC2_33_15]|nr:MAG: NADH:ubiquinone oxidoreductase [Bacteroidetes bacterium GWA2_33_15]OFX51168.1 MAG: NADH:ubiquinone oxidoreductase [Bacteroidetes bacterium GWC2_33_15]OFX66399.1 MAG: NADH:ubiquinone oxidoreductase [Bacteroidetes bacterium GWB2_32_14]OFX70376.1 MAG: NADH:ubiquinone oxidoreductase [Bacteroidetes bacterium GWD2_33_33]HAN17382.1 NADH:ubiquinone oxidoreductase [Bacteroidales bacterium]